MIRFCGVGKTYNGAPVVENLDLEISPGELVVLLGESGCGKTTTLNMINRLVEPSIGVVEVNGANVSDADPVSLRRSIGYVFQGIGLFPHLTIGQNIGIVPRLLQWPEPKVVARADELLDLVDLEPASFRSRYPSELSGGQRQRVGVARALAARQKIVLMDEPFGALDPITRQGLQKEYLRIHKSLGITTVLVTHDMVEAALLADRIAILKDGHLMQYGPTQELLSAPSGSYVSELVAAPIEQARAIEQLLGAGAAPV